MTDEVFPYLAQSIESLTGFLSLTIRASKLSDASTPELVKIMLKHSQTLVNFTING